jgi:hypothetical protein
VISADIAVRKEDIDKLVNGLKELGKSARADLGKNMKRSIMPLANQIAGKVTPESPFKGMRRNYYGEVQWAKPKASVATTPSRGRGVWTPLVTIALTATPKLGFDYTENAGSRKRAPKPVSKTYQRRTDSRSRSHTNTTQGENLIRKAREVSPFNFKAGHFAYGYFLQLKPQLQQIAIKSLETTADKFNIRFGK